MGISTTYEQMIKTRGKPEQIHEELVKFRKDVLGLAQQRAELTKKYPNKWIAFYDEQILFIANSLEELLKGVEKEGISLDRVVTQYLSTEKIAMIL